MPLTSTASTRWSVAAVSLAALTAVVLCARATTRYGLGIDGDAAWTLSAGSSLAHGAGLVTCLDELFSLWPPLYPTVMALLELAQVDVLPGLRVLHLLALATTVVLGARTAFQLSRSHVAAVAAAWLLASSSSLHEYTVQVVSETFFLPLVFATLLSAATFARAPQSRGAWWATSMFCALACLQRYLGVTLIVAVAVTWLAGASIGTWRVRLAAIVRFAALALVPLILWFVRNRLAEDKWTGGRDPTEATLASVANDALDTVIHWASAHSLGVWSGWLFAVAILAALVLAMRRSPRIELWLACTSFALVYAAILISMSSAVVVDRVGPRLMLPLLPVGIALGTAAFALVSTRVPMRGASLILFAFACGDTLHFAARKIEFWRVEGAGGYRTRAYQEHPLTEVLKSASLHTPCWSNVPEFVWLERKVPVRFLNRTRKAWRELGALVEAQGGPVTVIWVQLDEKPKRLDDEWSERIGVSELPGVASGAILTLRRR